MKKYILVIEGGGAEGLLACGALYYLIYEAGIKFDALFGTSIGGAVCLALSSTYTQEMNRLNTSDNPNSYEDIRNDAWKTAALKIKEIFKRLKTSDLIRRPAFNAFFGGGGLLISDVDRYFEKNITKLNINELKVFTEIYATDLDADDFSKRILTFNSTSKEIYKCSDVAAMSSCIPAVFSAFLHPYTKHRIFDGGICSNNGTASACEYAEAMGWTNYSILTIRLGQVLETPLNWANPFNTILRLFAFSRENNEQLSLKISSLYERIDKLVGKKTKLSILTFNKEVGLLSFGNHNADYIEYGYQTTRKWVKYNQEFFED